jgi:hypothetical protein
MYYTVYKTTNQVNGKFYIGTHKTVDLNDDYIGSGKYLKYAIEKHGIENFKKEILFVFDNPEEMFAKEAEIVTKDFLAEENTYNLKVGGFGGFDYINKDADKLSLRNRKIAASRNYTDPEYLRKLSVATKGKNLGKQSALGNKSWTGKIHSDETKNKIGNANKKFVGKMNSQFGTMWITNPETKLNKKIAKSEPIPIGWVRGRKFDCL